jgi:tetratricopeptide (TPR) repeat protein
MSGAATFSGTTYQAGVIAYVYVHILKQSPLGWFDREFIDTPIGVSGETEGPGDDARIEFGDRHSPIEIQAKHGLTAGGKLSDTIAKISTRSAPHHQTDVVLIVDRTSSKTVHVDFAADLERYRAGRTDRMRADLPRIVGELGAANDVLRRVRVVVVDVDRASDPERKNAAHLLEEALVDPGQASSAWAVLAQDAAEICARRLQRTRQDILNLLTAKGIAVRPPQEDEVSMQQLDFSKRLLAAEKGALALSFLEMIEADLTSKNVAARVWFRLRQHRATALLMVHRAAEALIAAREALDIDADGVPALLTASYAAVEVGDLPAAAAYLERVLKIEPSNVDAWAVKVQVDTMAGEVSADPPSDINQSEAYQFALVQIAMNSGDLARIVAITKPLIAQGKRNPRILLHLTIALAALGEREDSEEYRVDAERIADEALTELGDEHPLAVSFLAQRAELRRTRGDIAGCEADLQRARELNDDDPNALALLALSQLHAGHPDHVLVTLSAKPIDEYPMLLLIRAQARTALKDLSHAREDLDLAISRSADAHDPNAFRLHAAEIALDLKDVSTAKRLLDAVTPDTTIPELPFVLRGRIAFDLRDAEAMESAFREAATVTPGIRAKLFPELAQRLVRLGCMREAVAVFEEIGWDVLPPELHGDYAGALVASNDLVKAANLVKDATEDDEAPDWKLHIAAEIAARRGDVEGAAELLARVARRHPDNLQIMFELARRLLLMNQAITAMPYLDGLLARSAQLDAPQNMMIAHLLKEAGRQDEATKVAFRAYRASPQDPAMHRGFSDLIMLDPKPVEHPGFVTADTYVRLVSDTGEENQYIIYADPPVDPLRHEILLGQAEHAGYVGKRVGDVVVLNAGTWQEKRWRVAEILPAIVYVWRDIVEHYELRFPGEPFFVQMFKMSDEPSVKDLAPVISSLNARRAHAESVFKIYRESVMPLGFVASMLGLGICEVMAGAMTNDLGPLAVEWFDAEGQEESRSAARVATQVVITRSALETLAELDLLDQVRRQFEFLAPHTLIDALKREVVEAQSKCATGQHTLSSSDAGLHANELPANHPSLVARLDRVQTLLSWVQTNARIEFRPLEMIGVPESREEEARTRLGNDSTDSVHLTEHFAIAMLADDLGLRRFVTKGARGRSFSCVALIPILAERGAISAADRDRLLLRLVERRYAIVPPTKALLVASLHPSQENTSLTNDTFALLGGPAVDLATATTIAVQILREAVLAQLQVTNIARIVTLALDGMSRKWPPSLCAYALLQAAASQLALMPRQLKEIRDTATTYLKRYLLSAAQTPVR